jgi:hypothetical protein
LFDIRANKTAITMRRFAYSFLLLLGLGCLGLGTGCGLREDLDDLQEVTLRPELALPLLNTVFDIDSLLPRLNEQGVEVSSDPEGLITLAFEDSLFSYSAAALLNVGTFQIPVQDSTNALPIPLLGGGNFTRARVKSGRFFYGFSIGVQGTYEMVINLPDAQRNGQPLTITRVVSGPATVVGDTSLLGYEFVMPDGSFGLEYTLRNPESGTALDPQGFAVGMDSLVLSYAEGSFTPGEIFAKVQISGTSFFSRFEGSSVQLEAPRLYVDAENGLGMPLVLSFDEFTGIKDGVAQVSLQNPTLANGIELAYPTLSQVGQTRRTELAMDNSNSNLSELLELLPDSIRSASRVGILPAGSGSLHFIDESSRLTVRIRSEIPLDFSTPGITYRDTFALTSDFPAPDLVEWVEFKMLTENGLPLASELQIFFYDENQQLIDSLYDQGARLMEPAPVDTDGRPSGTAPQELLVMLTREEYEDFSDAAFLGYRIDLRTTGSGSFPVKLYNGQQLGIKLGLRALLNVSRDTYDSLTAGGE